jgi:tryptophan 2,3-dioxygenase
MKKHVHYADYILKSGRLLELQETESEAQGKPAHDEKLFVIVHQVYELWFKQILHEIGSVMAFFEADTVDERQMELIVSRLRRVTEIQKVMNQQVEVLETMTPMDFLEFRHLLTPASGFQSLQFRLLEARLGLSRSQEWVRNLGSDAAYAELKKAVEAPSLLHLVDLWLSRTPFLATSDFHFWDAYQSAVRTMLADDRKVIQSNETLTDEKRKIELKSNQNMQTDFDALFDEGKYGQMVASGEKQLSYAATHAALFIQLYRDEPILQLPFRLLTSLIDIDELLVSWRYRHMLMVERMLGLKIGTGGSSGAGYLRGTVLGRKVFEDISALSTFMIPRSALPTLPEAMHRRLGFFHTYGEKE